MTGLIQSDIFLGVIAFTLAVNLMVIVILVSRIFFVASGDIESGSICLIVYDGTNFQLLSPIGNAVSPGASIGLVIALGG